jgi:hypothetical protein
VVRDFLALLAAQRLLEYDVSFALFFYAFTFLVPIAYLSWPLKKTALMLWMGSLALAFSIYNIRFTMPFISQTFLTMAGILLFAFSYFAAKS